VIVLVELINHADRGITIKDGDTWCKFDKFGKFVTKQNILSASDLISRLPVVCVSVISCAGGTDVYISSQNGIEHMDGTYETQMNLTFKQGYIRRVSLQSVISEIQMTQTIFLYNTNIDLKEIKACI